MLQLQKIRPRFPEARSYTARGVHPAALLSYFISSRQPPLSNRSNGPTSEPCARRECRRSPLYRVWLGWRVGAKRSPDLSNNRNAPDRFRPSDGKLMLGLCTRRADTSCLRLLWLQPSFGHGTVDNVPLHPPAMRAGKRSQVLAQRTRLNRRQLHW
jgi:hypothetical protein